MTSLIVGLLLSVSGAHATSRAAETQRQPVIDMHLHAIWWGPKTVNTLTGLRAPETRDELQKQTLAMMEQYNIVKAVVSGDLMEAYKQAAPEKVLPGLQGALSVTIESVRELHETGRLAVLAEFAPQYEGLSPADDRLEPYFAIAEELDIPMGIHIGLGPPGAAYSGSPKYRMTLSNPLLLDDVRVVQG